jgi:hypothetical protein
MFEKASVIVNMYDYIEKPGGCILAIGGDIHLEELENPTRLTTDVTSPVDCMVHDIQPDQAASFVKHDRQIPVAHADCVAQNSLLLQHMCFLRSTDTTSAAFDPLVPGGCWCRF